MSVDQIRAGATTPHDAVAQQEIAHEQAFVDRRLRPARAVGAATPQALAREGHGRGRLGHEGGLVERDAMVFQAAKRIATLDAAHEGLVFGRLDLRPSSTPSPRYIGRIGLRDEHRDSLLIDWRAPGRRGVLPGHGRRAAGRRTPPGAALRRRRRSSASRTSCSTPRPRPTCRSSARAR